MKKILVTIFAILSFSVPAIAAPGDLDLTFNGTGKATTNFGTGTTVGRATAVQTDGKIVIAGYYQEPGINAIALARYNLSGSLDTSFDGDGKVTTAITNNSLFAIAVAVQNDGKILVAGVSSSFQNTFFVARYNADGSPDTSFDTDGIAFTPNINAYDGGNMGLAIQADGKIVAAGTGFFSGSGYDFCVARFNTNGSLDATFDTDGIANTSTTPNWDYGNAVAIQADGRIVVAGQSRNDTDGWDQISIVRYNTNGSLDATFDGDGKLTTTVGSRNGSDGGRAIAVQSDNKIVVAGFASMGGSTGTDFAFLRYNTNGSLDTTFDADGKVTTTFSGSSNDVANSIIIQPDGKIITAGSSIFLTSNDFAVIRYNADGSLDNSFAESKISNSFGNDGKVTVDFAGGQDIAYGVTLDSSGRVVLGGSAGNDFGVVRLQGLTPTAANASVSGRVLTANGRGLSNAIVSITDQNGNPRTMRTGTFGYYRFDEIEVGQTVVISVLSKRLQFEPRILAIAADLTNLDFVPIESNEIK